MGIATLMIFGSFAARVFDKGIKNEWNECQKKKGEIYEKKNFMQN